MTGFWIGCIVGMFFGAVFGIIVAAMCAVAKQKPQIAPLQSEKDES